MMPSLPPPARLVYTIRERFEQRLMQRRRRTNLGPTALTIGAAGVVGSVLTIAGGTTCITTSTSCITGQVRFDIPTRELQVHDGTGWVTAVKVP